MPYVKRDGDGKIISLHREAGAEVEAGGEFLPASHPEVQQFLGSVGKTSLEAMDLEFIRVIEDVIDLLVDRNLIMFTDLPPAVQAKLNLRRSTRNSVGDGQFQDDIIHL